MTVFGFAPRRAVSPAVELGTVDNINVFSMDHCEIKTCIENRTYFRNYFKFVYNENWVENW